MGSVRVLSQPAGERPRTRGLHPVPSYGHIPQEGPSLTSRFRRNPLEIPKASDAEKEHFRSVLPDHPEVVVKPMFGNLGAFVNGNMFAGLFGPTIGVKLADADREELEAGPSAGAGH